MTTEQDWLALEPAWTALVQKSRIGHPFCDFLWFRTWWEAFGANRSPRIIVVSDETGVAGIAPLMISRGWFYGWPVRRLESIANDHSPRFDWVVRDHDPAIYDALWSRVRALGRDQLDLVVLKQLPSRGLTSSALEPRAANAEWRVGQWRSEESPYIPLVGTWDSYVDRLGRKHRSNLRNRLNRLERLGAVTMEVVSSRAGLDAALEDALRIEASGWKRDEGTAIQCLAEVTDFYRRLAPRAADAGWLRLLFLKAGESRIAFVYGLECAGKLYALKVGYDQRYSPYSPSKLLCYFVFRDCYARGLTEYEFLGGCDEWKLEWTSHTRAHDWLFMFPDRVAARLMYHAKFTWTPRLRELPILRTVRASVSR